MKKRFFLIFAFLTTFIPYSCEDSILFVDCDKCFTLSLVNNSYSLEIDITIDKENSFVPITIYSGDIDNGEVISEDTAYSTPYYSDRMEFDRRYSAVAKYSHNGRIIFVVDGKILKKKFEKSSCNDPCYIIQGDVLDLRLK